MTEWSTLGQAVRLCIRKTTLARKLRIALVVGTIMTLVNQAASIIGGAATVGMWLRVGANYVVPLCVSSVAFLSATRARSTGMR